MPSKAFTKVQKSISKKRGGKPTALHENSRDAQRLKRASARDGKLAKLKTEKERSYQSHLQRVAYFRTFVQEVTGAPVDAEAILTLAENFVGRNDEEFAELKEARRAGRPPSTRETQLKQQKEAEQRELLSGFWVPDVRDEQNLERLKEWSGDWVALGQMKFIRIDAEGAVKEGQWPPNR